MKSPVVSNLSLVPFEVEEGLRGWRCGESGGCYISAADYWKWQSKQDGQPDEPAGGQVDEIEEAVDQPARICPESGRIMIRCKVGHGLRFTIDRSPSGFWLDGGEWEALRAHGLHRELHRVFSSEWQHEVRMESARAVLASGFEERLGPEDHARACEVRSWLEGHPRKSEILAWLSGD